MTPQPVVRFTKEELAVLEEELERLRKWIRLLAIGKAGANQVKTEIRNHLTNLERKIHLAKQLGSDHYANT